VDLKNTSFRTKFEKYLSFYAYIYNIFIITVSLGILLNFIIALPQMDLSKYYMEVILFLFIFVVGISTLVLTFLFRKADQKFWMIYAEIENLNRIFLKTSTNQKAFGLFNKLLILYIISLCLINIHRIILHTLSTEKHGFHFHYQLIRLMVVHLQFFWIKYIFYIRFFRKQLKSLRDYGDFSEAEFLVLQRILTGLWKMSKKLEKSFQYQLVLITLALLFTFIFTGYFAVTNTSYYRLGYILFPFFAFAVVSFPSENCLKIVSLRFIAVKSFFINLFC